MISVPMARGSSQDDSGLRRNVDLVKFPKSLQFESFDHLNSVVLLIDDRSKDLEVGAYFDGPFGVYVPGESADQPVSMSETTTIDTRSENTATSHLGNPPEYRKVLLNEFATFPSTIRTAVIRSGSVSPRPSPVSKSIPITQSPLVSHPPRMAPSPEVLGYDYRLEEPETSIFSETDNSYVHFDLLDLAKLTILAIKGPRFEFSEQSMFHILYPKFFPNMESDEWRPGSKVLLNYFEAQNGGGVVLKPLLVETSSYITAELISFVRVAHPNNPWDLWVVPLIKTVIYELVCEDYARNCHWRNHFINKSATEVSRDLLIRNIKLAILCMVLSSSAFQKSLLRGYKHVNAVNSYYLDDDMRRSIELRKVGINMLNYHLDEYDNNSEFEDNDGYDTYMMLALILQVQLDNAFGVFENYELIFAIGDFILNKKAKDAFSPVAKYLRNVFHVINIFYESTQAINFFNFAISEKERNLKYLDLNENYDLIRDDSSYEKEDDFDSDNESIQRKHKDIRVAALSDKSHPFSFTVYFNKNTESELSASEEPTEAESKEETSKKSSRKRQIQTPLTPLLKDASMYVSWGLPKSLIQLLHEVTQLANHKNVFQSKGVTPRNFPRLCAELEDKIMNWNVEDYWKLHHNEFNPISNVATKVFISSFHEGLFYYVTSFQNALLVYYKRLIPRNPIQAYQKNIEKSLEAMEKLLVLDAKEKVQFSPSFWPLLICGCDIDLPKRADLQERCQNLWKFECFKKYNYWRSKQILYEIWSRRTQEGENLGFMDMIREWDIVLCLG